MNIKDIEKLIGIVETAEISHLSIENDGTKIEIKKEAVAPVLPQATSVVIPQAVDAAPVAPQAPAAAPVEEAPKEEDNFTEIKAQMVGTFYTSSSPDAKAYVSVGDTIKKGQTICIIEAMKLFNEIEADFSGRIEKICVENGSPVEYGQVLFLISES